MIGFNRRFDPGHRSVHDAVANGTCRETPHSCGSPAATRPPPPPEYVAVSGGIFLDMVIHDFDMAPYVVGSPVVEVYAKGAVRVDPRIGEAGDIDTAVSVLTHADGTLTTIDNSREAVYGFDQRVEAFGSGGMAVSDNPSAHAGWSIGREGPGRQPLPWFFLDRYMESYRQEWRAFHNAWSRAVKPIRQPAPRPPERVPKSLSQRQACRGAKAARSASPRSVERWLTSRSPAPLASSAGPSRRCSAARGHDVLCLDPPTGGPAVAVAGG
jgi:predicted dehydrogenase